MKLKVIFDTGNSYGEFEYFSRYNRINAAGLKDEVRSTIIGKYGKIALRYKIVDFYKMED